MGRGVGGLGFGVNGFGGVMTFGTLGAVGFGGAGMLKVGIAFGGAARVGIAFGGAGTVGMAFGGAGMALGAVGAGFGASAGGEVAMLKGLGRGFVGSMAWVGTVGAFVATKVVFGNLGATGMMALGAIGMPEGLRGMVVTSAGKALTALARARAAKMKERITSVVK